MDLPCDPLLRLRGKAAPERGLREPEAWAVWAAPALRLRGKAAPEEIVQCMKKARSAFFIHCTISLRSAAGAESYGKERP